MQKVCAKLHVNLHRLVSITLPFSSALLDSSDRATVVTAVTRTEGINNLTAVPSIWERSKQGGIQQVRSNDCSPVLG